MGFMIGNMKMSYLKEVFYSVFTHLIFDFDSIEKRRRNYSVRRKKNCKRRQREIEHPTS